MAFIKISIPVYKKDNWQNLQKDGRIEVSSDVDDLSDGYKELKDQIDQLLLSLDAETRLAKNARALELEIENKAYTLKTLIRDIEKATQHYESLRFFLEKLGIDPIAQRLTFDKRFLLQDASSHEIEVVNNQSEF
ncbi:MAG: hypothetical protein JGK24_12420 [Microcoleus sp. PH2017_29_MFU_D_A]|uniref:hypothetical protein n=1 Tax=unclassified Microcoleus TaxID=2642155 RepID=UPI001D2D2167|nr:MULTISPECIES: hypothetical protein [unclassified Microcoleus]MCC3417704.1 hypothetical protein [Microcoleus sp. PH2017_07_MST_O_A]MCC3504338.1 hypothetical protein [Microcoleus sp. PH2017_19_SFW_U_A]MCC3508255.1 hypothetical protein [Microcoleus sp. PH2017_17_BER_D_A]TAE44179.1 MAG: hypothetical protein EAZ90_07220 [Oscillatoriales cyanobacterium]MCC3411074.1 hypothetical protein [Microcoleus sp. PH2017_02_FOX_O_A]